MGERGLVSVDGEGGLVSVDRGGGRGIGERGWGVGKGSLFFLRTNIERSLVQEGYPIVLSDGISTKRTPIHTEGALAKSNK